LRRLLFDRHAFQKVLDALRRGQTSVLVRQDFGWFAFRCSAMRPLCLFHVFFVTRHVLSFPFETIEQSTTSAENEGEKIECSHAGAAGSVTKMTVITNPPEFTECRLA